MQTTDAHLCPHPRFSLPFFTLILTQMFCKYYMKFTDMSPDLIEANTCRDTFMTPEQAKEAGIIDDIYASAEDNLTPPAVVKGLQEAGLIDRLSGGVLSVGRSGTL